MKKIIFALLSFFITANVLAQSSETIVVKGADVKEFLATKVYKYPQFIQSKIYFKKGGNAVAKLNYNYLLGGVQFINEHKDTLMLDNVDDLDYLTIANDTIFYDNGYLEWMASSPDTKLARRISFSIIGGGAQKVGAFGSSNNTQNMDAINTMYSNTTDELSLNEEVKFKKTVTYFIKGRKGEFMAANKSNFEDVFPKVEIKDYIKQNNLNLKKEKDVVDLFLYANHETLAK
ncbi:MAG: hypothetical protein JSU03_10720 [Bacteroidetes bacterium]|nr:hypothetical protein [Bacteroidota bacterium]MBS1757742.1 hypothetical protein [Bacteroidota bacterium]